jgi:hypothetical protein
MANARLQISDLDFDQIKDNLKTFLKQQTTFQDYDFEGSGLNVLLDILAYNTHYNSYYLNMVANESFLDTAVLRDSVVSHAKTLGYVPHSMIASKAVIDVILETSNTTTDTATIGRGFSFSSSLVDGLSYNFVVLDDVTVTKSNTTFQWDGLQIYEGNLVEYEYTNNLLANPKSIFSLPDSTIDTSTIKVVVQPNIGNSYTEVYTKVTDVLDVNATSKVYFLQEAKNGQYQIYFGDGSIGKALEDGAIINISYLITNGPAADKSTNFVSNSKIKNIAAFTITTIDVASGGSNRETVDSIKYSATSQFTTQNRLVTLKDYESYIIKNYPSVDAVSVWGGEEEVPPSYGKVYLALKPKQNYYISETEKQRIIDEVINPKAIVSVEAVIRNPEYLYLKLNNYVEYYKNKTVSSQQSIKNTIKTSLLSYANVSLNKFDSTFILSKAQDYIDGVDLNSIAGSETILRLEKRFTPSFSQAKTYEINFNSELHRGTTTNRLSSTTFQMNDNSGTLRNAIIEEIPESFTGISEIEVTNAGSGYVSTPTVTITGDGTGAQATAKILNGRVVAVTITNRGINYSRAVATITGGDGYGASAIAILDARFGTLRTIYYDENAERQVINSKAGTINYATGRITIDSINIISTTSADNQIRLDIESEKGIIKSNRNTIITIDSSDPSAITTELVEI